MKNIRTHHRSKSDKTSSFDSTKQYTEKTTEERHILQATPPHSPKNYLTDEIWDILPKTDYTYARSGSYSPRFLGRKYKFPNMSRYRIRANGRGQETEEAEFSDDGEELMHIGDYNDYDGYHYYDEYEEDRSSNTSYETVLVDGMSLRSGKSLQTMQETINEHHEEPDLPPTAVRGSLHRSTTKSTRSTRLDGVDNNTTSKKLLKSQQNARHMSMSEQKSHGRRSFTDQKEGRRGLWDQKELHGNVANSKNRMDMHRRRTISTYTNSYDSSSVPSSPSSSLNSVHTNDRYQKQVRKTLEYDEVDSGEREKAALEIPEKMIKSSSNGQSSEQFIDHLYGLDSGDSDAEFSDTELIHCHNNNNRVVKRSHGQQGTMLRTTTIRRTVGTTNKESIDRMTKPVRKPTWNFVGKPWWTYLLYPILAIIYPIWAFLFGKGSGQEKSQTSSQASDKASMQNSGQKSSQASIQGSGQTGGQKSSQANSQGSGQTGGQKSSQASSQGSGQTGGQKSSQASSQWSGQTGGQTRVQTKVERMEMGPKGQYVVKRSSNTWSLGGTVWAYLFQPIVSTVNAVWVYIVWKLSGPANRHGRSSDRGVRMERQYIWRWSSDKGLVGNISTTVMWILWRIERFITQFILLDVWLLSRRRNRGCCYCLPLILLIPFIFTLASYKGIWSGETVGGSSFFSSYFGRPIDQTDQTVDNPAVPPVPNIPPAVPPVPNIPALNIPDNVPFNKQEFFNQMNAEVKGWCLQCKQLQNDNQLSVADVEEIVHRILQKELACLREEMAKLGIASEEKQEKWRLDHEERLEHINKQYNSLLVNIQNLESAVSKRKDQAANIVNVVDNTNKDTAGQQAVNLAHLEEKLAAQKARLEELEREFGGVLLKMKDCCHDKTFLAGLVRDGVDAVLKERMAGYATGAVQDSFSEWLKMNFANQENGDSNLKSMESDLRDEVLGMIAALEKKQRAYFDEMKKMQQLQGENQANLQYNINTGACMGIEEQKVKALIEAALLTYSADRIGIPDYALESAGGTIISTRCSETYYRKTALLSVFGIPLWYSSNSPRTIIQPEVLPGQCWAFSGAQGYIVIQTSTLIVPNGFTLEHISKSLSPSGKIDTAPKDFTVLGLETESDQNGISLGNYTYTDDDRPLQYFPVQVSAENLKPFQLYELRILNNHGSIQFTCLYRFRIHGKPFQPK